MPNSRSGGHSCGLIAGPEIVVVGGMFLDNYLDDVDIYTVDSDSWREGRLSIEVLWISSWCRLLSRIWDLHGILVDGR